MSVDTVGRIIVGSGHFIESAPGIIAQLTHVAVGGGHMVHIQHASQQVQLAAQNVEQASHWIRRVVDDTIRETAHEAWHREVGEQIVRLGEAGGDIVEAYGWAAAGDLQSAWEKLVDAAVKTGEVFLDGVANPPQ